ncbi:hypothetical protein Pse7367_2254 [Thalassoporum mexicanum PCC 7367]|uniref:Panacea domain-containing protein n=1 Tax=Thalassoporum mexicanum TaxID=3457544 RepID=UPI00029F9413|nr:type II toxin-antitoxin system antitoxin SocA domain-containing protein [Pseudanabaena sp. PCC 7367]AFY70517.1 hypothetical protein Pse7367_2254 [Pseudanabaena sp. PCC 7367]
MISCFDVANFFLSQADEDAGDLISNLKLQKLVYYAQGFHLAMFGQPLFSEEIQAWVHGPVIPELYQKFKIYDSKPLPSPEDFNLEVFKPEVLELLEDVQKIYGQFSAWKLKNMTYEELPWSSTETGQIISYQKMKEYFKTLLVDA